MDLEVVGRHALFFDDDSSASFVNSAAALVEWNSLSIDRYDVRHLLSALPPRVKRRHLSPPRHPDCPSESELDRERYLDLPSTSPEHEQDLDNGAGPVNEGGFHAVPFLYGNADESTEQRNVDAESGFQPPFSLPESLLQNLPPSEKVHQIIARTAMFVNKHGGQSEIILRVKQGDNPTFGFLMPHHHLHAYFRFLVDHPELLREENKTNVGGGGALSLLGSVYGSGEDEDAPELKRNESDEALAAVNATVSKGSEQTESSVNVVGKDETVSKHLLASLKEKAPLIKRNQSISTVKARSSSGTKREGNTLGSLCPAADKSEASALPRMSKVELPVVEPPSDTKRVVDKIVEFILRNGKEFEAILVEQDRKHGRFSFLLQSNLYYPYYLKALHKAEELSFSGIFYCTEVTLSKLPGKGFASEKHDLTGLGMEKKNTISKESATLYLESDIPYDSDRKEKFKMVLGKSKKDAQDEPSKPTEPNSGVTVDAVAAAAILQAARRGIRNPDLLSLRKMSVIGDHQGPSSEGGQTSSLSSFPSSRHQSSMEKMDQMEEPSVSVPAAKAVAKSSAVEAASEAGFSEASLSREQKLKAERLKRAKMFTAMVKNKAVPLKAELHCQSVEPTESGFSESGAEIINLMVKEKDGSSGLFDADTSDGNEKSGKKDFADDTERRSKRKYRSRSTRNEEEEEEEEEEEKNSKHSRRKRQSHRSSHQGRDRKRHSSSKDRYSRHHHKCDSAADNEHQHSHRWQKYDSSSDDEHRHCHQQHKHDSFSDDEHWHSRCQHKHDSSSDDEHSHSRHQNKQDRSSDDKHQHRSRSRKHRKRSCSEREVELEEGEIKSDQSKASEGDIVSRAACLDVSKSHHGREASVGLSKSCQDGRASSQPSNTDEVSDDLRAKIRAMLMSTL